MLLSYAHLAFRDGKEALVGLTTILASALAATDGALVSLLACKMQITLGTGVQPWRRQA